MRSSTSSSARKTWSIRGKPVMATEVIHIDGQDVATLKELLRPDLKAVFVGLNPSPSSVVAGHYYQGKLGQRLWERLQTYSFVTPLSKGQEDEEAFAQGFGFVDLVRRPTLREAGLSLREKIQAVPGLLGRLSALPDRPKLLYVFKAAYDLTADALRQEGFDPIRLPPPYASKEAVQIAMPLILSALMTKK